MPRADPRQAAPPEKGERSGGIDERPALELSVATGKRANRAQTGGSGERLALDLPMATGGEGPAARRSASGSPAGERANALAATVKDRHLTFQWQ